MQQLFDFDFVLKHAHRQHQLPEVHLVENAILIKIEPLEVLVKFQQESFMFFQLKIKYYFLKIRILMLLQLFVP